MEKLSRLAMIAARMRTQANTTRPPTNNGRRRRGPMAPPAFWALVEASHASDATPAGQIRALGRLLKAMTPAEVEAFQRRFWLIMIQADGSAPLRAAAGPLAEDELAWRDLRACLVAGGMAAFNAALKPSGAPKALAGATRASVAHGGALCALIGRREGP